MNFVSSSSVGMLSSQRCWVIMKVDIAPDKASVDAIIVSCSFAYSPSRTDFLMITSDSHAHNNRKTMHGLFVWLVRKLPVTSKLPLCNMQEQTPLR